MPSIWISNTNKSHLFGFVWAPPRCERKVGGMGRRILELLSQNIDGTEPVPVTLQPETLVNVLQVTSWQQQQFYLCGDKVDLARSSFSATPSYSWFHTVTPPRWKTTTVSDCWPQNSSDWTFGGCESLFGACKCGFMTYCRSCRLSACLEYKFLASCYSWVHIYSTIRHHRSLRLCVLCCCRWIHCFTASAE